MNATTQEAWNAYNRMLFEALCDSIVELNHQTQDGHDTGFSGAGYSLYSCVEAAVATYCKDRQSVEPNVPNLSEKTGFVCLARFAENPTVSDFDRLVEIDMENRTIDIVDKARVHYTTDNPYFIKFDQFKSVCDLFEWIRHLEKKTWFTMDHAVQLVGRYEFLVRNGELPSAFYSGKTSTPNDED